MKVVDFLPRRREPAAWWTKALRYMRIWRTALTARRYSEAEKQAIRLSARSRL
jgi:hypothetical protein